MSTDQIAESRAYNPTDADLSLIYAVIPGDGVDVDPSAIKPYFNFVEVTANTVLPAHGMYVVLRGSVQLRQNGTPLASADVGDYFYEEHLEISDIPVSLEALALDGTRLAYLSSANWKQIPADIRKPCIGKMFGDLVNVHLHEFQQPINCCSVTAAALSMSALGFSCEVNDIFRECALPSSFVVNDGISLGELFDIACTYIYSQGLRDRMQVQAYFMDEDRTDVQKLLDAIDESNRFGGDNDILVANFQVGVAHGKDNMPGGHFAIIAKCNPSTGLVHMMDVHPEKYGKLWVTTATRLWEGMSDRDGTSMRSRGILRFSARTAVKSHLKTFDQPCNYIDPTNFMAEDPKKRRNLFRRASPNMNSLGVLVESLAIHGDHQVDEDKLLRLTGSSFQDAVSRVATAEEMHDMAHKYLSQSEDTHLDSTYHNFATRDDTAIQSPEDWFKSHLQSLKGDKKRHLMINIDFNRVLGSKAIHRPKKVFLETALLEEFWCLCVDYDEASDLVTIMDMSPATSQVWQAPRGHIFRGLRFVESPELLVIAEVDPPEDPNDVASLIERNTAVLFYEDEDPMSYMLKSVISNIGATDVVLVNVAGRDPTARKMRRDLAAIAGKVSVPYLFFDKTCISKRNDLQDILDMVDEGILQDRMREANLAVSARADSPSLDKNIFGYPKGGLTDAPTGRRNILLCACGSSAADKIPTLVEKITDAGHNVKLIPSVSAEKFFRDFGEKRIAARVGPNDYYRDDDEWNFRYMKFDMPVRASHLALCDWADCVIVAPVTCNTMGKIANGIADNLLTSIFVAWQYRNKPVILCPACNTNMWNNVTTQNNVEKLRRLGVDLVGPRKGRLSNGMMGIGMMALPDQIMDVLEEALEELEDHEHNICRWAQEAAASDTFDKWKPVFDALDNGVAGVDIVDDQNGDTLLHYAAGGEGELNENDEEGCNILGKPDHQAAKELIKRGINVNATNDHGFTALHVAAMNNSPGMVELLLSVDGVDASSCLQFVEDTKYDADVRILDEIHDMLKAWAQANSVPPPEPEDSGVDLVRDREKTYLYFTYGSLKKGFPNHAAHAEVLSDFVGEATTRQPMPLIVPNEPYCDNPNCDYLHRMATLVGQKGRGKQIRGEVYRVSSSGLKELDKLEGFHGPGSPDNVYIRKRINVMIGDVKKPAYAYVIAHPEKYLGELEKGASQVVAEYTLDMATGTLKEGREAKV